MNTVFLLLYFAFIFASTFFLKRTKSKEDFLVANRNVGPGLMAMSIAATWIWAPALFVSAQQAYQNGWQGLFWFTVPNVACLLLFIPFAIRFRHRMPQGYTLSEFMGERYSPRVKGIYLFQLGALSLMSTVVQLLAGGKIVALLTGIPFWATSAILGGFCLLYSMSKGIRTSVFTDALQLVIIIGSLAVFVPWVLSKTGAHAIADGLIGVNGTGMGLFEGNAWTLFLSFGIPTMIGLLSGPFGDQNFWQRTLTVRKNDIAKAFMLSALLFASVPLLMGMLGFISTGIGFAPTDPSVVNLELLTNILPEWTGVVFIFVVLSGLLSTINSNLSSFSGLANDVIKDATIPKLRWSMTALAAAGVLLSNIPVTIIDFFLIYGTLRASTFATTVLTLAGVRLSERGVFYGVISSLVIGLPLFVWGSLAGEIAIKLAGSVLSLTLSGLVAWLVAKIERISEVFER